jgi:hypothetical protein
MNKAIEYIVSTSTPVILKYDWIFDLYERIILTIEDESRSDDIHEF